jgi:tellurite methyltransferase
VTATALRVQFGDIDIYLFDQLLRGRIRRGMKVLDAGSGSGRNLVYLLREGHEIYANDASAGAVDEVRRLARELAPGLPASNIRHQAIEDLTFPDASMDVVISSAVLHFARDPRHFNGMVRNLWRILAPGGMLFCRLASTIGMEHRVESRGDGRFLQPDGSERYLVDESTLMSLTATLGGTLLDPLKTTIVQDQRAMTTWVVGK